ncbi:MAG: ATP-binding protein [Pseudomonadota bacterium]
MTPARRVAILGSASSGKTTLALALARHYDTAWVPEYLREFVDGEGRLPVEQEQIHIARTQVAREAALVAQARQYLFCDTTPLMTAVYSRYYFHGVDAELAALARQHTYDVTLLCAPDIPWVPEGFHREQEDVSGAIFALLVEALTAQGVAYTLVSGAAQQRLTNVERILGGPVKVA